MQQLTWSLVQIRWTQNRGNQTIFVLAPLKVFIYPKTDQKNTGANEMQCQLLSLVNRKSSFKIFEIFTLSRSMEDPGALRQIDPITLLDPTATPTMVWPRASRSIISISGKMIGNFLPNNSVEASSYRYLCGYWCAKLWWSINFDIY